MTPHHPPDPALSGTDDGPARPDGAAGDEAVGDEAVSTLRGASVHVDLRAATRVVIPLCLVSLAVLVAILYAAGANKNAQLDRLHHDGVPVQITITGCIGLLGGSGSNAAGYSCNGTFVLDGQRHLELIPGNSFYEPGTTVAGVTVHGDPALVVTAGALTTERTSSRVYVLPTVLLVVLLAALGVLVASIVRRRRTP